MKKVYSARDEVDAHLVQGLLSEQGIEAVVQAEGLSGIIGNVQTSSEASPSLWVSEEDEAAALAALEKVKDGDSPSGTPVGEAWQCPKCNEMIEAQFTECWNCGESKPGAEI